jgi:hypothetical protein
MEMGCYYKDGKGNIQYNENGEPLQLKSATMEGAQNELEEAAAKFGTGIYLPGLVAYMPGWKAIWQMNSAGEFVQIVGGDDDE